MRKENARLDTAASSRKLKMVNSFETRSTMSRTFLINVIDQRDRELYGNHGTFHAGDAGLDLFVCSPVTIEPKGTVLVDMGVRCQLQSSRWCGLKRSYHSYFLWPRSSISKTPLILKNSIGLIDSAYTGNIKAAFFNTATEPYTLERGQRLVQLVSSDVQPFDVQFVDELRTTSRGGGGFGSTGR